MRFGLAIAAYGGGVSPDHVLADLRLLEAAGIDPVTLRLGVGGLDTLELFARDVAPAFGPPR